LKWKKAHLGGWRVTPPATPIPKRHQKLARAADAVLLGAVGGPKWDTLPREQRPERGLLGIRKELGLFANLRPAILYPELANASTLKPEVVAGLDILIVRELTGDIYFGQPRGIEVRDAGQTASASASTPWSTARVEIRRIGHVAFEAAPQAQQEAVLGRQDERARMHAAVARRDDRAGRTTRMSS
jgi:3-isopropylmalate dehydrogenase